MFFYFGYGSNISVVSLRAKGVDPLVSEPAILEAHRLTFDIPDFFSIEGGTGNIRPSAGDEVHGVLHGCRDADLTTLDRLEALGVTYERIETTVRTYRGQRARAYVYVGMPTVLAEALLPSRRYKNILVRGAIDMRLERSYVGWLESLPTTSPLARGPFVGPEGAPRMSLDDLASQPSLVAIAGHVFDMSDARPRHAYLQRLLGGRDVTLLFLKRMDTSDGSERFEDVVANALTPEQRAHVEAYLHEFAREYRYVGAVDYAKTGDRPPMKRPPSSMRGELWSIPELRDKNGPVPARAVLDESRDAFAKLGHDNAGPLSEAAGFMPRVPPSVALPPAFAAWDDVASRLPSLYAGLRLRRECDALPVLAADEAALDDEHLLRAAALLAILSHAYHHVETQPPRAQPAALAKPWAEVRRRLERGPAVLTYFDLIVYNHRLVDPDRRDPMRLSNMRLLLPTVDNEEERTFYLTQTEILAQATPIVGAVVRAQEAAAAEDDEALESELLVIIGCLERVVRESLLAINPNPRARPRVDPIVWAKTVAPFAVPMVDGVQGPSGTSSPIFNTLDIFLGRKKYETFLGREIYQLRDTYPVAWRRFLAALHEVSVPAYVARRASPRLTGLMQELIGTYAGQNGFLGRHRMKVFGYIELAFKVGRSVTIGGFKGVFKDRTWDQVDSELEKSRVERVQSFTQGVHHVQVKRVTSEDVAGDVVSVTLDISGSGIRYEVGDRCGVLPENDPALVEKTMRALSADGNELVRLTPEWLAAIKLRAGYEGRSELTVAELLRFGRIRPLLPRVAEALHALTQDDELASCLVRQATDKWELWDAIELLRRSGFDPRVLFRSGGEPRDVLSRIVPPETFRMYSISSVMHAASIGASAELCLTIGRLRYKTEAAHDGALVPREGAGSTFLANAANRREPIAIFIEHPPRFELPRRAQTPIVMVAGGTGVSPFRGFLVERQREVTAGEAWLILGLRSREHFAYGDELVPILESGRLDLSVAFSRDDVEIQIERSAGKVALVKRPGQRRHVAELLREDEMSSRLWDFLRPAAEGGRGAHLYVCGRTGFARSILRAINAVFRRFAAGSDEEREATAESMLEQMVAEGRLLLEIFGGEAKEEAVPSIDVSDIARMNDEERGYWTIIDGRVYDVTSFVRLHPGGAHLLRGYAGMDATDGFARAHAGRTEIDAMREMYAIGSVRRLDLDAFSREIEGPNGLMVVSLRGAHRSWVRLLHLVVEMQNALRNDHLLQSGVTSRGDPVRPRSRYKLQRAIETHVRFLKSYVDTLALESMPALFSRTAALLAPGEDREEVESRVMAVRASVAGRYVEKLPAELDQRLAAIVERDGGLEDLERSRLTVACDVLEEEDLAFLEETKRMIIAGVEVFEELESRVPEDGGRVLVAIAKAWPELYSTYLERLTFVLRDELDYRLRPAGTSLPAGPIIPEDPVHTVYGSRHWLMEEDAHGRFVVLRRTPVPFETLADVVVDNENVIAHVRAEHAGVGVLVDMRQAPPRNDPAFENAMQRLRKTLATSFARVAVLLESPLGVLQVDRIGRDEGTKTFATLSELAALEYVRGHTA